MRHKQLGITLIELMIVVAIVGILSAIAYPSYRQYVIRSNRTEAKMTMMKAAQELEKCFTRFGRYDNNECTAYEDIDDGGRASETGKYVVTFGQITDMEFRLQAVPQGAQAVDGACATLTLDQTNARAATGTDPTKCW